MSFKLEKGKLLAKHYEQSQFMLAHLSKLLSTNILEHLAA